MKIKTQIRAGVGATLVVKENATVSLKGGIPQVGVAVAVGTGVVNVVQITTPVIVVNA
jgi:hypothetical protein